MNPPDEMLGTDIPNHALVLRKPRADSKLKNLPPERQQEIYDYLSATSIPKTLEWLRLSELHTNTRSLHDFRHWYELTLSLDDTAATGETVLESIRERPDLNVDEPAVQKVSQTVFEAQALQQKNSRLFVQLRKLRLHDQRLHIDAEAKRANTGQKERRLAQKERQLQQRDRQIAQKDRDQQFQASRWAWTAAERIYDAAKDPKTQAIINDSGLSRAEKIAAIRKAYFADIDAEEVIIPP